MTNFNSATLPNGLRVIHLPTTSPVVYCGYQVAAGSRNEAPGEEGLAHFCEHMAFKGTRRRSALQVINGLERVGGDLNAFTTKERTVYHAAVLRQHVGLAIDLLSDIVFDSQYPEAELEREKAVVCDEIESYNDTPAELIYDEFENLLFPGHPLGHSILGTEESVRRFRADDLRRFTRCWYAPGNTVFFASGDIDFRRLLRLLEKSCGDKDYRSYRDYSSYSNYSNYRSYRDYSSDPHEITLHTHQAHVMIGTQGYSLLDSRRWPLFLLNNLLGGPGMSARLNLSLRERHGLVYTVESTATSYADTGTWAVYFGCDHHDIARCQRLVRRELDRLMQAPLSDRQLAAAKRQLKGQLALAADNREQSALDFGRDMLFHDNVTDLHALYAHLDAVTAEDIHAVACQLFAPEGLTTLVIK